MGFFGNTILKIFGYLDIYRSYSHVLNSLKK